MDDLSLLALKVFEQLLSVPDATLKESHSSLWIYHTVCGSEAALADLQLLSERISAQNLGQCWIGGDTVENDDPCNMSFYSLESQVIQFSISKASQESFCYFFYVAGLRTALMTNEMPAIPKAWIATTFDPFASWSSWFLPWGTEPPYPLESEWQGCSDPRKLVRNLTKDSNAVPHDIRPWLLRTPESPANSEVLATWQTAAAKQLAATLPSEIIDEAEHQHRIIVAKGQRHRDIIVSVAPDETSWLSLFPVLHDAALWIYRHQDSDVRHTFFNYHLALEYPEGKSWPDSDAIAGILANSTEAHRLHLHQASQEHLKAQAELRKSLHEEVNRVSQNTNLLVTSMWRDFSISAAVIALRFLTDAQKALSPTGIKVISVATALFIMISLFTTIWSNRRFHNILTSSRKDWRKKIFPFINDEDFNALVDAPIRRGMLTYRIVAVLTSIIYLAIAFYLVHTAFPDLLTSLRAALAL